mmetsp:Transcript_6976/g.13757  ORF Transcript_6976/g.13757 Transcript_6976/m.13757 type:complete len:138 (+) Transcript_6976:1987-2400(+)
MDTRDNATQHETTQHNARLPRQILDLTSGSAIEVANVLVAVVPESVEHTGLVDAFVGVSPEEVALGLDQVCRQTGTAVLVVVGKGSRGGRDGDSVGDTEGDNPAPGHLAGVEFGGKTGIDHEIGEVSVPPNGFGDSL